MLRDAARKRGLSTAVLAESVGLDRGELKRRLAGQDDLAIDDFLRLAEALGLTQEMSGFSQDNAPTPLPRRDDATGEVPQPIRLQDRRPPPDQASKASEPPTRGVVDPDGNAPRQLVEAGFALGLDMFLHLERRLIGDSGVPPAVLADRKFAEVLPIRLEAKWHRHNRPEFLDEGFRCTLSFDALYTCTFPWRALRQVGFTLPPEPEPPVAPVPEGKPARPVLRLVKE
jgi:transcriptional regulator with XRE-family HTH domain